MDDLSGIDFGNAPVTEHFSDGRRKNGHVIFAGLQGDRFYLIWKRDDGVHEEAVLEKKTWFGTVNYDGIIWIDRYCKPTDKFRQSASEVVSYKLVLEP